MDKKFNRLVEAIVSRVKVNLAERNLDAGRYVNHLIPEESFTVYYALYAVTPEHPPRLNIREAALAGTYFLGRCEVARSILYKCDVRGDELKRKGQVVPVAGEQIRLFDDEKIDIRYSFLVKTLIHNNSHDLNALDCFRIHNTVALHFANIHGAPVEGCFLEPFSTVDLCNARNSYFGCYAYVQAGDIAHERIEAGRVWIRSTGLFEFDYTHPAGALKRYISLDDQGRPQGLFLDFHLSHKEAFDPIYNQACPQPEVEGDERAFVSPYAVVKGSRVEANVLIAQGAYVENSILGHGSNAQENCAIIDSTYAGECVTAHGGKVICTDLGRHVFVGFNAYVAGRPEARVHIGCGCIVMPHTILDAEEPLEIPEGHLVWGYIRKKRDLETNTMPLDELTQFSGTMTRGSMYFIGEGEAFVNTFRHRIDHILEENGAMFDGSVATRGHAQRTQNVSFNIIQPYREGEFKGICPRLIVEPPIPT
ncbi:MAG: transferase [Desulfovibrionaceae bacterium]